MKKYIVNLYGLKANRWKTEMTEDEYNKWVEAHARDNYGIYRIVGEPKSDHFYIDFEQMYEVTVIEN